MSERQEFEYLRKVAEAAVHLSAWIEAWRVGAERQGIHGFPDELETRNRSLMLAINPDLPEHFAARVEAPRE